MKDTLNQEIEKDINEKILNRYYCDFQCSGEYISCGYYFLRLIYFPDYTFLKSIINNRHFGSDII